MYSHLAYDVTAERVLVHDVDVLLLEGLNVLQPRTPGSRGPAVRDFFDATIYVDADAESIRSWYVERFMRLRNTAFRDPASYFHRYAKLSDRAARAEAERLWDTVNGPNLEQNIARTRGAAGIVLRKRADHRVAAVLLRQV